MKTKEDQLWQNLLARSAPTFAPEAEPPYGLVTRVLTRVSEERRQQDALERLGLRAIFASMGFVAVMGLLTVGVQMKDREDLDPGVKSMALVENIQVS